MHVQNKLSRCGKCTCNSVQYVLRVRCKDDDDGKEETKKSLPGRHEVVHDARRQNSMVLSRVDAKSVDGHNSDRRDNNQERHGNFTMEPQCAPLIGAGRH